MNLANFVNEGQIPVHGGDGVVDVAKIADHIVGLVRVVAEEHLDPLETLPLLAQRKLLHQFGRRETGVVASERAKPFGDALFHERRVFLHGRRSQRRVQR